MRIAAVLLPCCVLSLLPCRENVLRRHAQGMGIKNYGQASDSEPDDEQQQQQRAQAGTPPTRKTPPRSPLPA
jgi:hypothetical protein